MAPKRKPTPFQNEHALLYGVLVTARDPKTSKPTSVLCHFCGALVREMVTIGRKRSRTQKPKFWKSPFRTDNCKKHHDVQHPEKWLEYGQQTNDLKMTFFDVAGNDAQTSLFAFTAPRQGSLMYLLDRDIVKVFIGQQLLHPDDVDGDSHERAMASFKRNVAASEDVGSSNGVSYYTVTISNPLQFRMAVRYLSAGLSFRQCCSVLQSTKAETGMAAIGSCQVKDVTKRARFACAVNLQTIASMLESVWAFSVAADMSTHMGTSYLDVRLRICWRMKMYNLNFLSIPMHERHTGEAMFEALHLTAKSLYAPWVSKFVGVATDGAPSMTSRYQGFATRMQQVSQPGFSRVQ